ncbi:MAG: hypothetical protein ED555_10090 [Allomuricauda sp.]|nr:MAG: hypothetical protein ED555_10090 [Allomuricauda sp.]
MFTRLFPVFTTFLNDYLFFNVHCRQNLIKVSLKKNKIKIFKKGFRAYYLLVVSIIGLTIAIQTIIQYSLDKQRSTALIVNLAGKQRMLSQRLLNETYSCRYHDCDYAELKLTLNKLYHMHRVLQEGDEQLGIEKLENEEILLGLRSLQPHVSWFKSNLYDVDDVNHVSFVDMRYHTDRFLEKMDKVVLQFQKKSEEDIRVMGMVELQLAVFSVLIVLFEILFIVNPIINRIMGQKKKLREIAWHQSRVFGSHMKQIKELKHVFKIEKDPEKKKEIFEFVFEELEQIEDVSKAMVNVLKENEIPNEHPYSNAMNKLDNLIAKYGLLLRNMFTRGDKVHSLK